MYLIPDRGIQNINTRIDVLASHLFRIMIDKEIRTILIEQQTLNLVSHCHLSVRNVMDSISYSEDGAVRSTDRRRPQ